MSNKEYKIYKDQECYVCGSAGIPLSLYKKHIVRMNMKDEKDNEVKVCELCATTTIGLVESNGNPITKQDLKQAINFLYLKLCQTKN